MPVTERLPAALGPYRLQDRLGEGGMGVVHLALDPDGNRVAIKVLQQLEIDDGTARRRLAREVETMRRVHSPYVAEVLDADVTGEYPYIVTRYVQGPTLDEMVRARGPLSSHGLRRLAHGTAEALAAIHAAGVVHRDLKPGNVMLTDDRPIVIDFGIAQVGDSTRLTQTGLVMGTPGFLSPEVIEGHPSSPASDVHSWGSTMAYAATGRLPFGSGTYESIFYRIVSGRADLTGVPAQFVPLISAALARDPAHRPSASWLSAQATSLDLSASGPSATAIYTGTSHPTPFGSPSPVRPAVAAPPAQPRFEPVSQYQPAQYQPAQYQRAEYPAPKQAARDVADLLPPVESAPPARRAPDRYAPNGAGPGQNGARQNGAAPNGTGQNGSADAKRQSRPNTMAGLALMAAMVALTVVLPVAGLLVSLALITLLRAADRAQSRLAVRRSVRGPRPSDPFVVLVTAPLAVVRALLTEVLMAPLALAIGAVVYAATVVVTHSASMTRPTAYAVAAVVAAYGIGPGSGNPRRQVNRIAGAVARSSAASVVLGLAVWAVAAAVLLFAVSQTPDYWPAATPHLPGLGGLLSSAASWLHVHVSLGHLHV